MRTNSALHPSALLGPHFFRLRIGQGNFNKAAGQRGVRRASRYPKFHGSDESGTRLWAC